MEYDPVPRQRRQPEGHELECALGYTIKETAKIMNLPASTLRYYEKEGLLPNIGRKESGYRIFSQNDLAALKVIECLKKAGLSIKEIRCYIDLAQDGDASLDQRYQIFLERRQAVIEQMEDLKKTLDFINYKCWYYETAIEAGTEKIHTENNKKNDFRLILILRRSQRRFFFR